MSAYKFFCTCNSAHMQPGCEIHGGPFGAELVKVREQNRRLRAALVEAGLHPSLVDAIANGQPQPVDGAR